MLNPTDHVIDTRTDRLATHQPVVDGEPKGRGLVPRDYALYPREMFDPPSGMPLIPRSEWSERIKDQVAQKSRLSDLRWWPSLDQNGQGYCWMYSTTSCVMLLRTVNNQPYVRLSAHAGACKVKNFRDEGGWCGLSAKFHREVGQPSVEFWPEKSMSRSNDRPETWANGALHKVTEEWVDLTRSVYDQNLTFDQVASCLLSGIPCAVDFNWWAHSVCGMDLVDGVSSFDAGLLRDEAGKLLEAREFETRWLTDVTAGFAPRILNSWTDGWGDRGTGVLAGSKGIPDGAVALRVTGASEK